MHARFRKTATLDVQIGDPVLDPGEGGQGVGVGEREDAEGDLHPGRGQHQAR